jgi:hypothetical protein
MPPDKCIGIPAAVHKGADRTRVITFTQGNHCINTFILTSVTHRSINETVNPSSFWQGTIPFIIRSFRNHTHDLTINPFVRYQSLSIALPTEKLKLLRYQKQLPLTMSDMYLAGPECSLER